MAVNASTTKIEFGPELSYEVRGVAVGEEPGMWCSHPSDPNQMIGVTSAPETTFNTGNFLRQSYIVKRSEDGGRTWKETLRTSGAPIEVDPACAYGVDGQVFVSAMSNFGNAYDGANVWRSSDDGRTWEGPVRIDQARFFDRPFLNIDRGDTPYRGRLYIVAWGSSFPGDALQRPDEMVVYTSDDGGRTFGSPAVIPTGVDNGSRAVHPGETAVLTDGTFITSWTETDMKIDFDHARLLPSPGISVIKVARSVDGGRSFGPPIEVAKSTWRMLSKGHDIIVSKYYPTLAADRSEGPFRNNIYIAWADANSGRQEIVLSRSTDGGTTWSTPSVISEGRSFDQTRPDLGPHNKMVVLRVNSNGAVGAAYYAQTAPDPHVQFQAMFTASMDGGVTWSAPGRVTGARVSYDDFNLTWDCTRMSSHNGVMQPLRCLFPARATVPNCLYGLVTDAAGQFRVFAFTNPYGKPTFSMRVARVIGAVTRRREVDSEVQIDIRTVSYDSITQTVTANVTVTNVSQQELALPIRLVMEGVSDNVFVEQRLEIQNSDNGRTTSGAWWDFESSSGRHALALGERSAPRTLKMRFTGRMPTSISSAQRMMLQIRAYKDDT